MATELTLAFENLDLRASADDTGDPPDRISLRDYIAEVEIGAFQRERGHSQRVRFNIVVEVGRPGQPFNDDVDRILSYDTITEAISAELGRERLNLLETLAENIADRILASPKARRVFIRIEKLDLGPGALGVEIVRTRAGTAPVVAQEVAPAPLVVHLGNDAIHSDRLAAWLDQLQASGLPTILTVQAASIAPPRSGAAAAQRRIDLLAIEQNAWVLAGRDRRCIVVGTRTELDWAMRNGNISVWAPSKMVVDCVSDDAPDPGSIGALVGWFAGQMGARAVHTIGDTPVPITDLPVSAQGAGQGTIDLAGL